ncbi:TRAP transporter small permease [Candidatus Bathyarchaeota archaeon]|nr:TRAP transporter small permease [Candidatus Bathyarchaeota archaeon]
MQYKKKLINFDSAIGVVCLGLLLGTILLQVVLRFVFSKPLMGAEEFTRYMVICVIMFPLAYSERSGSTIVMEEIQSMFPKLLRNIVNMSSQILTTVVYGIVAASAVSVLINNVQNRTATLEMPFWLFFAPSVVGLINMTVVRIIVVFCKLTHREKLPWESQ